jgi:hypothetical protein
MWKKVTASIAGLVVICSLVILYRSDQAEKAHLRLERQAAQSVYQEFATRSSREVPPGTSRAEVKKYLDGQKLLHSDGREIMVKLGEFPDEGPACDRWSFYASYEFGMANNSLDPTPQDRLRAISMKTIGHCL